jgi:hypothetical protein
MVSNLLKRWQDDFVVVKRQRDGLGAFLKRNGMPPHLKHCIQYNRTFKIIS